MKTQIVAITASVFMATTALAAPKSDRNREEGIGIGTGGVIGAIAGGPVGFIIGAATGGWLGNKFHTEREARTDAEARVEEAETLAASLHELVESSENEMALLERGIERREEAWRDALSDAFEVQVYFHTGDSALAESVAGRVERLGEILKGFDDVAVIVEGHADPRGDETYNEQLSAMRAAAVTDALLRAGVASDRITTRATGETESVATDGDLDAMALERRVDLRIVYPLPRENRVARQ